MSYVAFKTRAEFCDGVVVINIDQIASVFQREGDSFTAVVLTNTVGYQISLPMHEVLDHIAKSKHQTIDGALKLLQSE